MTTRRRTYTRPLSALDQVLLLEPGRITTLKAITANEPFFPGHYPDNAVYPGVFIVEAVCQAVQRYAQEFNAAARLRRIVSTRFQLPLQPGDVLQTSCVCLAESEPNGLSVRAACTSATGKVADVKAVFQLDTTT